MEFRVAYNRALQALERSTEEAVTLFEHGTLSLELYRPVGDDRQTPHERDEVYIVASGTGTFQMEEAEVRFQAGDFLFVPAGASHRFTEFTPDFSTWVLFYGPREGERGTLRNLLG
ncbi:cupin domain-containing protein [Pontibacter sp. FD36]|uniref:cupin domain-containing protein n=1 Tax=Pontibacter sp. FD36 TaxID=2789860 RepID=UPI0018AB0163|nr:cupin domain-containing protein [Pontibacter sp. FD36]MBF8964087.1 cupin domain-containing protein [Pontibacter sp. FD36]